MMRSCKVKIDKIPAKYGVKVFKGGKLLIDKIRFFQTKKQALNYKKKF